MIAHEKTMIRQTKIKKPTNEETPPYIREKIEYSLQSFKLTKIKLDPENKWNIDFLFRKFTTEKLLFAMKLNIFRVESTLWDPSPLDWCNQESRQKIVQKIHVDAFTLLHRLRYYMFCWHSILRLQTKWTFWSIIGCFDPLEKRAKQAVPKFPSRRFYYQYRSQYSDLFWYSVHFLVRIIGLFFHILLIEQRWNANLAHSRLRFSKPMSQLSTGVRPPSVLDYKACLE